MPRTPHPGIPPPPADTAPKEGDVVRPWDVGREKPLEFEIISTRRGAGTGSGRPRMFDTSDELMQAFYDYRSSIDNNPDLDQRAWNGPKGIVYGNIQKPKPLLVSTFLVYLGICHRTWQRWREQRPALRDAIEYITECCAADVLEGALTGRYHSGLAARHLGLVEKQELRAQIDSTSRIPTSERDNGEHEALHIHPDDPSPLDLPRPLYSRYQLEMGMPFTPPPVAYDGIEDAVMIEDPETNEMRPADDG